LVIVKLKIGLLRYWMLQYSVMDGHRIDSIRLQLVICKIEDRSAEILDVTIFRMSVMEDHKMVLQYSTVSRQLVYFRFPLTGRLR